MIVIGQNAPPIDSRVDSPAGFQNIFFAFRHSLRGMPDNRSMLVTCCCHEVKHLSRNFQMWRRMPRHVFAPPMLDDSLPVVATHFSIVVHWSKDGVQPLDWYQRDRLKPELHAFAPTVVIHASDVNRPPFTARHSLPAIRLLFALFDASHQRV